MPEWIPEWLTSEAVLLAIATFVSGFLVSRFTMTKKERTDTVKARFDVGQSLIEKQTDAYNAFKAVLEIYLQKTGKPDINDFFNVSSAGEKYFTTQKLISDAILAGQVDPQSRDNTLVPSILESINKSLPAYYETLQNLSKKGGFPYEGSLDKNNYRALYTVVEKYGQNIPKTSQFS